MFSLSLADQDVLVTKGLLRTRINLLRGFWEWCCQREGRQVRIPTGLRCWEVLLQPSIPSMVKERTKCSRMKLYLGTNSIMHFHALKMRPTDAGVWMNICKSPMIWTSKSMYMNTVIWNPRDMTLLKMIQVITLTMTFQVTTMRKWIWLLQHVSHGQHSTW